MEKLENCGYCGHCGHKPYISIYFSLRDQEIIYHVECPFCHHIEITDIDKNEAINKWNYLYPSLFPFE